MKKWMIAITIGAFLVGCKDNTKKTQQAPKARNAAGHKAVAKQAPSLIKDGQKPSKVLAGAALASGAKVSDKTPCKIYAKVSGMVCQHGCAPRIRTVLKGVKGISEAMVSYKTKSAVIEAQGQACAGKGTQKMIDKAFAKEQYKCKVSKIEIFAKTKKAAPKNG